MIPVVLIGFDEPALARLRASASASQPALAAALLERTPDAARAACQRHEQAVIVLGAGLAGDAARAWLTDIAPGLPLGCCLVIVLAANAEPAAFAEWIDADIVFYLSQAPPPEAELLALLSAACTRLHVLDGTRPAPSALPTRDATRVRRLLELSERAALQTDAASVAQLAAEGVPDLLAAERGACLLYDAGADSLWNRAAGTAAERRAGASAGLASYALRTGQALSVPDVTRDARFAAALDAPEGVRDGRLLVAPVMAAPDRPLAVLMARRAASAPPFERADLDTLVALAAELASPLRRLAARQALAARAGAVHSRLYQSDALRHHGEGWDRHGEPLRPMPGGSGRSLRQRLRSWLARARTGSGPMPFVAQTAAADCGAACLSMVLAYWGRTTPLQEVRALTGFAAGADAASLIDAGRFFGLRGRGVRVTGVEDLRLLPRGAILHWRFNHFVVFDGLEPDGGARLVDPALGRQQVGREELRRNFTGVALLFEPGPAFERGDHARPKTFRPWRYVLVHRRALTSMALLSIGMQAFALGVPLFMRYLADDVLPQRRLPLLGLLSLGALAATLGQFVSSLTRARLLVALRARVDERLTLDFLDHLVDLPYAFFQQRSTGDLLLRLQSNAILRDVLTSTLLSAALDTVLVLAYLGFVLLADALLAALVGLLGLARIAVFLLSRRRQRELTAETLRVEADARAAQVELLAAMETLKAAGSEPRAVERAGQLFVRVLNASARRGRLQAWVDASLDALRLASPLALLALGAARVLQGELSLGGMLAVNALAMGFLEPLSQLVSTAAQMETLRAHLDRLGEVFEAPKEQDLARVRPAPRLGGRITLESVSFRYHRLGREVLRSVSLDVQPGQFVAIVGPSGAGKSTLAALMVGLYEPDVGQVRFDGQDLRGLERRSLRRQIGVVPQHPYLFGMSVRANLELAEPGAPLERLVEAARRAHVHDDIVALPMGYDTVLADRGASLSGGQRQRLALARALVADPAILLLDEATSALDAVTEARVQAQLRGLRATRILIAHRLSTVRDADLILVLEDGRLVEQGQHAALLARGGLYAALVMGQVPERVRS
jgi:ABC-type bacteriocin/lantibiotic exporter with double-glycine peptidase domain